MGTCQFLDSRTRLPRDLQTRLQASADEFHMSFVLSAACTSAGIQADHFLLGHAEATVSIIDGAGATGGACSLPPPSRFRICRQHTHPGLLRGTAEHRKLSIQRHETPVLRRIDCPATPVLAGSTVPITAYQPTHGSAGRISSKDRA